MRPLGLPPSEAISEADGFEKYVLKVEMSRLLASGSHVEGEGGE